MSKKLFEPIEIKGMRLRDRLGFAPLLSMPAAYGYVKRPDRQSDPETPNKYLEGRPEDIRVCTGCMNDVARKI